MALHGCNLHGIGGILHGHERTCKICSIFMPRLDIDPSQVLSRSHGKSWQDLENFFLRAVFTAPGGGTPEPLVPTPFTGESAVRYLTRLALIQRSKEQGVGEKGEKGPLETQIGPLGTQNEPLGTQNEPLGTQNGPLGHRMDLWGHRMDLWGHRMDL